MLQQQHALAVRAGGRKEEEEEEVKTAGDSCKTVLDVIIASRSLRHVLRQRRAAGRRMCWTFSSSRHAVSNAECKQALVIDDAC